MATIVELKANPFLGTWRSCDGLSDVEYTISLNDGEWIVSGLDKNDGEVAEIHNTSWVAESQELTFDAYWQSTGQITKYRFLRAPKSGRAIVTYTVTTQETWEKC